MLGLTPRYAGRKQLANAHTRRFNETLEEELDRLEASRPGLQIARLDVAAAVNEIVRRPLAAGFANVTDEAAPGLYTGKPNYEPARVVDAPEGYLFWDHFHLSAAAHKELGREALRVVAAFSPNGADDALPGPDPR